MEKFNAWTPVMVFSMKSYHYKNDEDFFSPCVQKLLHLKTSNP